MVEVALGATLSAVRLVTSIVITKVVVTRVAWLTLLVATVCALSNVVMNALLFHECDEFIDVVGVAIKLNPSCHLGSNTRQ